MIDRRPPRQVINHAELRSLPEQAGGNSAGSDLLHYQIEATAVTDKHFSPPNLPAHIEETVQSLAQLHADHHQNATPHERAVARTTALLAHPWFIGGLAIVVAAWMTLNLLAAPLGYPVLDPPPFSWLEGAVSLASLYMVVLILATQRREDQLTQRREQLTLELAILVEQKTAKIIQLLG
jgi:uncharacterized membrane protein